MMIMKFASPSLYSKWVRHFNTFFFPGDNGGWLEIQPATVLVENSDT